MKLIAVPIYQHLITTLLALLLTACAIQPKRPLPPPVDRVQALAQPEQTRQHLLQHFEQWQGVRHKLGGQSKWGIDCSAYTQLVYKQVFDLKLHRRVVDQRKQGKRIHLNTVQPGDLIFFKPSTYPNHVGIALSPREFIHVSSRKGVMRSRLDQGYWANYFAQARRITH